MVRENGVGLIVGVIVVGGLIIILLLGLFAFKEDRPEGD